VNPVPYARFADQARVNNDRPAGYARVTGDPTVLGGMAVILCRRGRDEVDDLVEPRGDGGADQ